MLYPPGAVERSPGARRPRSGAGVPAASGGGRSSRPFWGWVSDHIGRYYTLAIALAAKAAAILAFLQLVHDPIWSRG